jgi:hypothetical protein
MQRTLKWCTMCEIWTFWCDSPLHRFQSPGTHRHYHELLVFDTATLSEIDCIWRSEPQYRTITCRLPPLSPRLFFATDITTSCLYLIQQLYRKSLVFDTENLNIALSLVVSLHHLSPRLFFAHRHYHELLVFDTATLSEIACIWYAIFTLSLQRVNSYFHCLLPFFRVLVLFEMGMLNSLNPVC